MWYIFLTDKNCIMWEMSIPTGSCSFLVSNISLVLFYVVYLPTTLLWNSSVLFVCYWELISRYLSVIIKAMDVACKTSLLALADNLALPLLSSTYNHFRWQQAEKLESRNEWVTPTFLHAVCSPTTKTALLKWHIMRQVVLLKKAVLLYYCLKVC